AQRLAADQRVVVEHRGPVCDVLRTDDVAGNAPRTVDGRGHAGVPRHVQPAPSMAKWPWPLGRRARLARGSLRRTAGLRRSAMARAVADLLAGGRVVPAEYAADARPLASRLQLRSGRAATRSAAARAGARGGAALAVAAGMAPERRRRDSRRIARRPRLPQPSPRQRIPVL